MLLLSLDIKANLKSGTQEHIREILDAGDIQIYELGAMLYDTETRRVLERFYYWSFPGDAHVKGNWEALAFNQELLRELSDRTKDASFQHSRQKSSSDLVITFMYDLKNFLAQCQGCLRNPPIPEQLPILIGKNLHAYDIPILTARGWQENLVFYRSIDTGTLAMCMLGSTTIPSTAEVYSWLVANAMIEPSRGKLHHAMYDAEVNLAVWKAYETYVLGKSK